MDMAHGDPRGARSRRREECTWGEREWRVTEGSRGGARKRKLLIGVRDGVSLGGTMCKSKETGAETGPVSHEP